MTAKAELMCNLPTLVITNKKFRPQILIVKFQNEITIYNSECFSPE